MALARVRVRRERPTALAWAVALALTALAVYLLTLPRQEESESLFASATVTRQLAFGPMEAWCVTLADCETPGAARVRAAGLADRGAAGCVAELDGAWRVLGACFGSRREAERAAARIRSAEGLEAGVARLASEGASLRLTAPEARLDALAAGDEQLRGQHARLGELALQLDRGEIQAETARALCALAAGEAADAAKALRRAGAGEDLCASLAALLEGRAALLEGVAGAGEMPRARLSGLLRCAQAEGLLGQIGWLEALAGR